jgi:hypothetical protein
MVHATSLKRFSAVSVAAAFLTFAAPVARGQDQDLARANQDELASFYGRMNVVVGSGARAFGMGGAFLARADDATAASWNPAGLSYLRRTEVSLVGVHSDFQQKIPRLDGTTPTTTLDRLRSSVADFAGFAYPLRFGERPGAVQISYQRSFSFSGKRTSDAVGGGEPDFTVTGNGGFDSLSLSSGFEVRPDLRLGISVNRWVNGFSQSVERVSQGTVRTERTIASTWDIAGTNFNFGVLFTPTPKLNLGAVFKTPFKATVALSKTRTDRQTTPDESGKVPGVQTNTFAQDVYIRFPRVYGVGASYRASNTVTVSADFTRTRWSKATISDFFALAKKDPETGRFVDLYTTELPFPAVEEGSNGQSDTSQLRMGAEWVLRLGESGNLLVPLRAGYFRDGQPVTIRLRYKDPGFPSPNITPSFSGFTAGVGITIGGVLIDMAYIREGGDVPASRSDGVVDGSTRNVRYNRFFASTMFRFGPRR